MLSAYIEHLQKFLDEHGDMRVVYASDDECNEFNDVAFKPTLVYETADGEYTFTGSDDEENARCLIN